MKEFGIQIYSVREHFRDEEGVKHVFPALAEMGYKSIHTAGTYDFISPERFKSYADEVGIEICGTHYDYNRIKNDIEGTVRYHEILGTKNMGIGGMPMEVRGSDEKTFAFIDCSEYFIPKFCEEKFRSLEGFIYYEKKIFFSGQC